MNNKYMYNIQGYIYANNPSQVGQWMVQTPNLSKLLFKDGEWRGLVKIFAN